MNLLDTILDMLTEAIEFADSVKGEQPGMRVQTGFLIAMYLANKHPEYAAALFPAIQQKVGPSGAMFTMMIDLWVERLPIVSN